MRSLGIPALVWCTAAVALHLSCALAAGPRETPIPRPGNAWNACFIQETKEVRKADQRPPLAGFELLFYGDSITETWRGTDNCLPCNSTIRSSCSGVANVFSTYFGDKHRTGVMAIGGDQSAHLMWRMQNGQLPKKNKPKAAVLLIGTNDLGAAARGLAGTAEAKALQAALPGITSRLRQTLQLMRQAMPSAHIILMALLPRGAGSGEGAAVEQSNHRWPCVYTMPLASVNTRIRNLTISDKRVHFLNCGGRFLTHTRRAINESLMPDALHPNAAGHEVLARCLAPLVNKLLLAPKPAAASSSSGGGGSESDSQS